MVEQTFHLGIKAIIRNPEGCVLLLKRQGREGWDLPGGRVQQGESVKETLKREIEEETGLTDITNIIPQRMVLIEGSVLKQFKVHTVSENTTASGLILWLHSCNMKEGQEVCLSKEHQGYKWVSWREAVELLPDDYAVVM
jgi:8-oxo-dGTP pyrophosphatase MutT (NUDIX family)